MNCQNCKINLGITKRKLCKNCYLKEWRKNNPDKIKSYLKRNKRRIRKVREDYWGKNRKVLLANKKKVRQDNNYADFKTEKIIKDSAIRSKTRQKYPLNDNKCVKCSNKAEHRHHTTEPKEVDKFEFLCKKCHDKIHGRKDYALQNLGEQDE